MEGLRANVEHLPAALDACQELARCLLRLRPEGEVPEKAAVIIKAGGFEAMQAHAQTVVRHMLEAQSYGAVGF